MGALSASIRVLFVLTLGLATGCGETQVPPSPAASTSESPAPPQVEPLRRGLWVLCEGSQRVLEHPDRIAMLLDEADKLGVSDLFVQVYRGGRAWFDSSLADSTPYLGVLRAFEHDTLADLIGRAHARGLRVHAWVNVLSLASNRAAPLLRELGPDAAQVDRHGRSVLDYPKLEVPAPDRRYYRMGTPAVWIDPAVPGVAERLTGTFAELIRRYPQLDGLHLDYIRYPDVLPFSPGSRFGVGLDFGYGQPSRERFRAETSLEAPFGASIVNANRWDDWRRDQVTALVRRIGDAARAEQPDLELSAAVWAYANRAYLSIFQDWRGWLEEELLDFAVPMLYTRDDRLLRYNASAFVGGIAGSRVWIGLGAWLFSKQPERAAAQLRMAEASGAAGIALFSYDSIIEAANLRAVLAEEISAGP